MAKFDPMVKLTAKRRAAGIKQKELAKMLGVKSNTISAYECGRNAPSLKMLRKIAAALDCDPRDLI